MTTKQAPTRISALDSRKRSRPPSRPASPPARTLPLFADPGELFRPPARAKPANSPNEAQELALHVYWSASVESHVLALAAMRAEYPSERRALLDLRRDQETLKATAHRVLEQVWGISIGYAEEREPKERVRAASA